MYSISKMISLIARNYLIEKEFCNSAVQTEVKYNQKYRNIFRVKAISMSYISMDFESPGYLPVSEFM